MRMDIDMSHTLEAHSRCSMNAYPFPLFPWARGAQHSPHGKHCLASWNPCNAATVSTEAGWSSRFGWCQLSVSTEVLSSVIRPFAKLARSSMDGSLISPSLGRRLISLVNLVTVTLASGRKCLTKWLSVKLGLMTSPLISCRSVMVGLKHDYWSLGTATGRHRQCQETDKSGLFSAWSPQ